MDLTDILSLQGRVALITGAGSGIGKSTAEVFIRAGAKVGLLGTNIEELQATQQEIQGETCVLQADVSSPTDMERAIAQLIEKFGRLDVVVANAGINGVWAPLESLEPAEWNQTIGVNLTGAFLTMKYAVPHLRETRGNVIINASINGTRVFSNCGATAYACSKAAQVALGKMAALELSRYGIRVNIVCPGSIDTPIHGKTEQRDLDTVSAPVEYPEGTVPLTHGKVALPIEVARLILFLASRAARHITGTEIWIDGGESLLMG